jgi:hypothetical protein
MKLTILLLINVNNKYYDHGYVSLVQDEDKQNKKHSTICVGHHYTQANIHDVHKT